MPIDQHGMGPTDDRADVSSIPHLAQRLSQSEAALLNRPRLTIRIRLLISLGLCFGLSCVFALAVLGILERSRASLRVLNVSDHLAQEIHHAVAELDDETRGRALAHVEEAIAVVRAGAPVLTFRREAREIDRLAGRLEAFRDELRDVDTADEVQRARLRLHARDLTAAVDDIVAGERAEVEAVLFTARRTVLLFIGLLLVLFAAIGYFFHRALVIPIQRFQTYTERIATGVFTPIKPARPFRDEFTDLALAVNRMLAELQVYQDRGVRAGKLAAVGTITSGVAHELNNPLNNIAITTETLLEQLDEMPREEQWKLLQDIYFETERAGEIVKSLLDFARDERPEAGPVDLRDVVISASRLAQNEMMHSNVVFVADLPHNLPPVRASANQLRQVFLNLYLNAVHAMPEGGMIAVTASRHEASKVCIEVRDEGHGIPPEVLPHIFDPFFTTKEPGRGTGLGLSVSWSIVRKYGGEIQASSQVGKGTTFHVCLPAAEG